MKAKYKTVEVIDSVETGKAARVIRENAGLSQPVISRKLGVTVAMYSYMESGKRGWSEEYVDLFNQAIEEEK